MEIEVKNRAKIKLTLFDSAFVLRKPGIGEIVDIEGIIKDGPSDSVKTMVSYMSGLLFEESEKPKLETALKTLDTDQFIEVFQKINGSHKKKD